MIVLKAFLKNKLLPSVASQLSLENLMKKTKQPLINVFYHTVSDDYLPHINPLYKPKTRAEFIADIDFLLQHFKPADANQVLKHATGEKTIDFPAFHISFDDGLDNVFSVIAPILKEKNIPATVFVNSAFVDNKDLFFRYKAALLVSKLSAGVSSAQLNETDALLKSIGLKKGTVSEKLLQVNYLQKHILDEIAKRFLVDFSSFLKEKTPYLSLEKLKVLQKQRFTIGAHSIDHPHYSLLSREEQLRQSIESCDFVSENFGEDKRFFAFPFGDAGKDGMIFEDLFKNIDLAFGISGIKYEYSNRYIHRIDMETPTMKPKQNIHKAYLTYLLKNL